MIEEVCDDWIGPGTVRRKMEEGYVFGYLLENGSKAGFLSFGILDGGVIEIDKLYIEPRFRGRGNGKRVLDRLLEHGRSQGCVKAALTVNSKNSPAIALYEGRGFEMEKEVTYRRDGWPETRLYVMSLALSPDG